MNNPSFSLDEVEVRDRLGLHARNAALLVKLVKASNCEVILEREGIETVVDGILNLLLLAASPGRTVKVKVRGDDAENLMKEIKEILG